MAVGLIEVIEGLAAISPLSIRWPNDVESGGRKLAGILPERVETSHGPRILIGVGLNVSTRLDAAPIAVRNMATSLNALGGAVWDADVVLAAMLSALPGVLVRLAADDPGLAAFWSARDSLRGCEVRLDISTGLVVGTGAGIDATGGLILRTDRGPVTFHGGQVMRRYSS